MTKMLYIYILKDVSNIINANHKKNYNITGILKNKANLDKS